jgi:hypothetical protein
MPYLYLPPQTFIHADIHVMSKLFRLLASLVVKGVKPEELLPDRFPGKKPPTAAPRIPNRPNVDSSAYANQQIAKHYKSFRRHYPKGYLVNRERSDWLNDIDSKSNPSD